MKEHTLFVREGRWQISGSTIDVAGNPNVVIGYAVVTHDGEKWIIEEQLNESANRYETEPVSAAAATATFSGNNGAIGAVTGTYVFFEDAILTTYRSLDARYSGVEWVYMLDADRYESRGALFLDDRHVSSWSLTLQRPPVS